MSRFAHALVVTAVATSVAALGLAALAATRVRRLTASPAEPPAPGSLGADDPGESAAQALLDELASYVDG